MEKTTALEAFFNQKEFASVPVFKHTFFSDSLAEDWQWFCKTLSEIDPIHAEALCATQTPCAENIAFLQEMLDEVECPNETYIVFDNLCAPESTMETLIKVLSGNLPKRLHIVLSDIGDANTRKMIFDILDKTPYEVKLRHCESMEVRALETNLSNAGAVTAVARNHRIATKGTPRIAEIALAGGKQKRHQEKT